MSTPESGLFTFGSSSGFDSPTESMLKRKRSDSQAILTGSPEKFQVMTDGHGAATPTASGSRTRLVHDGTYYLEDGSCIILVQNTLFNVRRPVMHILYADVLVGA
jgi:hypothetical protein